MADISKIKLPNNEQYDVKDAAGRSLISNKIILSASQPTSSTQVAGDIWIVLDQDQGGEG